jgi:hypothetical protein
MWITLKSLQKWRKIKFIVSDEKITNMNLVLEDSCCWNIISLLRKLNAKAITDFSSVNNYKRNPLHVDN